ncbi:MAG TPA: glycosyltransferase [Peptococcaceae bacterium]|jgi:processive 1,2-diacylglycerol beta-glucosyltransferase|nr:glycosyltransferase [Clostridia bacterium]HOB82229.1 glycosyltransferase [Peptococcaceae bacterium]HPZ71515.1 glycosyltransferase [Peptococcaceae bacterium]HQD54130.1 glycosyltransferase [Peptococcaceae bacterium]
MMKRDPIKALIFSVSIGAGHDSVAHAVAERLTVEAPGSEVKIIDTFRYINSILNKVVVGSYMETIRLTPKVWGYLYDQAEGGEKLVDISRISAKILSPKMEQLINEFNPQVIICSHAFPTGMLGAMKQKGRIKVPLASAVTDYHIHPIWISPGVDLYFIPSPDLDYALLQEGIEARKIKPVGIPIRMQFGQVIEMAAARQKLQLAGEPVVLIMGGGLGLGKIETITKQLLETGQYGVVVISGKNRRLYESLQKRDNPRLRVYGYVENMAEVIAACDIVVSKPGGVTTAEVMAMGKPLVIYSSLPGQEDRNTDYLLNRGAAVKIKKREQLIPELQVLWEDKVRLARMSAAAAHLASPHSSKLLWEHLWSLLEREDASDTEQKLRMEQKS